jgi:hypothetical protein
VRYSSVKSLRLDVPAPLAGKIRNVTAGIRERTIEPRPSDAAEGYTPWSFAGEREFLGGNMIQLTWEEKSPELEIGRGMDYPIPVLKPMAVDRAWGQIVIAKAETLDVNARPGFSGLRPIDPQHDLAGGMQIPDAARAFEFHEDWSLTITATRYQLEDVKRTSVERAVLRMVVTRSGDVSVQALYRMRSAVQRLLVGLPENYKFDSDPLRINGRSVSLERGDADEMFVPLLGQNPDEPFVLELRYTVPGSEKRLDFPRFPAQPPVQSEPAVQKVYLFTYLPDEKVLVGSRGPWTSEQATWLDRLERSGPTPDPRRMVNWVVEGIALQNQPYDSFPTDGRECVFSTLHPEAPPAGSLRLVAWDERWISAVMFGGLAVMGLILARQPARRKVGALGAVLALVLLIGVFLPTFATQVLDFRFVLAVGLVVFLWLVVALRSLISPGATSRPAATASPFVSAPAPAAGVTAPDLASMPRDVTKSVDAEDPDDSSCGDSPRGNEAGKQGGPGHE